MHRLHPFLFAQIRAIRGQDDPTRRPIRFWEIAWGKVRKTLTTADMGIGLDSGLRWGEPVSSGDVMQPSVAYAPAGGVLAIVGWKQIVTLWNTATDKSLGSIGPDDPRGGLPGLVQFVEDGLLVAKDTFYGQVQVDLWRYRQ